MTLKPPLKLKQGVTIIETFVAITIMFLAIIGPLSMMGKYLIDASYLQNQAVATQLAQEGIELLIAQRDYNLKFDYLNSTLNPFASFDNCAGDYGCIVSPSASNAVIQTCPSSGCPILKLDENRSTAVYNYTAGVDTAFQRIIKVTLNGDETIATVDVTINWNVGKPRSGSLRLLTYLYGTGGY